MGDMKYPCPLCCKELFDSKQALITHLANIIENLNCPICDNKWSSVVHLLEHLSLDNCQPDNSNNILSFEPINKLNKRDENNSSKIVFEITDSEIQSSSDQTLEAVEDSALEGSAVNKLYVDLLDKQIIKPSLETQDLQLVKTDDGSRYIIVTNEDSDLTIGNTIVTKQNTDGTISFTSIADVKLESGSEESADNAISEERRDNQECQEEIYSCNTCGVSFTSVLDHIQNYHGDQEFVVEEPEESAGEPHNESSKMDLESAMEEDTTSDKETPRRVITDTGDIIEAPKMIKTEERTVKEERSIKVTTEKDKKVGPKRFVQVNELCDSMVKEIAPSENKKGPYHKVIVKEALTEQGNKVKLLHCMACNIYVSSLTEFKSYPCKALKYVCTHCPVSYENSKSLCAHMKVHKTKPDASVTVTYECTTCGTTFPSNKSLKLHKRMHDPIKSRPIQPPVASADGSEVSVAQYQCNICEKMIPVHYRTIHQNSHKTNDKMNCSVCNKKFSSIEYLEMHMNVHNFDKAPKNNQDKALPYNCLYCYRRFARPHEKVKHERIHTGEKPHSCEICGKSFRVSYCLTLHMRTHTGARPYACPHCPKRFKAHSVYNHHLLTHSEVRAYKCPFCPKAFKTAVQLAGHKNSHTKPFSCQQCNRPFASLYAVRIHTETHARQNNLKFSCLLCGASYARAFALKDHVKQVHKHEADTDNLTGQEEEWMAKEKSDDVKLQPIEHSKDLSEENIGSFNGYSGESSHALTVISTQCQ
ncbi:hypothetical protein K1T71_009703 [Dendrolimus kikuchii]|uniref:Uncharacterized protein n=1 Tax=Dendrolimus kikuchii TaxID=765133 RepID=A0ACC1CSV8_9NEOP|nr:hypothetical protein K1T71_009703 [Dendrolimus kikuchii]